MHSPTANTSDAPNGLNSEETKTEIFGEFQDLTQTVQAFGFEAIKDGSWFTQFLHSCLHGYHERVLQQGGEAYLRAKYPGLPTDAIASKLCELAEKVAAFAGGLSGAAASGAVLTAGAGVPAAVLTVMSEVLFTVRLQLRLVYDLHLLYGIPLDTNDPEDLIGIFAVVYGVKTAEVGGIGAKALGPEVMRAQLYRLIHGNTKLIQSAANKVLGPRIARSITQKAILKTAVPLVGTAISAGWNYGTTKLMGVRVRHDIRVRAALREETLRLKTQIRKNEIAEVAILEGMIILAVADKSFDDKERVVYMTFIKQLGLADEELKRLAEKVNADMDAVCMALATIGDPQDKELVARCFCLIVASDGEIEPTERQILLQLLDALDQKHLEAELSDLSRRFRREDGAVNQALSTIGSAANQTGEKVGEAVGGAIGWMKGMMGKNKSVAEDILEMDFGQISEEQETDTVLKEMELLSRQFAAGKVDQAAYNTNWAELIGRLQN